MAVLRLMHVLKIPVLWRHILKEYVQSLGICLFGIVTLLLTTKLDEVARFITLGASIWNICLFVLCQIPYLLQIAVPIASLVASFSVLSTMSSNGELTAARSSGYSLSSILAPICCCSLLIGALMMWGMFDLSARGHLAGKKLEFDAREEQPLAFLQSGHFLAEHGVSMELTGSLHKGETAKDLIACLTPPGGDRLSLVILRSATSEEQALYGSSLTVISSKPPQGQNEKFGSLVVENADEKKTPTTFVHELTQKRHWKPAADQFTMSVVRAMQRDLYQQLSAQEYKGHSAKKIHRMLHKFLSEPFRRLTLSLAVFSLCFAGAVSGIRTSRTHRRWLHAAGPLLAFGLFFASYLAGKNLDDTAPWAIAFYLLPHPILWMFSTSLTTRLERGMEY
jgi:lipopolysaccharide export system permease protein